VVEGDRSDEALRQTIKMLEEEIAVLRRRLQDAPRRVRLLEERLLEAKGRLSQAVSQNERLSAALEETRDQLALLRREVEQLTAPPNPFGIVDQVNTDGTVAASCEWQYSPASR
jgi:proteasome-associated ATPase